MHSQDYALAEIRLALGTYLEKEPPVLCVKCGFNFMTLCAPGKDLSEKDTWLNEAWIICRKFPELILSNLLNICGGVWEVYIVWS